MDMMMVRQTFEGAPIGDIEAATVAAVRASGVSIVPGMRVAVTAGSRGVYRIADILRALVGELKRMGALPFIVPAMGSHGGATAEGQKAVLEGYGVTEDYVGAPIESGMDVVALDHAGLECKLYMDARAAAADGVVVVNRVKPHTDFHGVTESGMMKMCVIGLGKHAQALEMHSFGVRGLRDLIPQAARRVIGSGKILMGVGICEDACDRTAIIRAVRPEGIEAAEEELIRHARAMMPSLPLDDIDVLIVDRMGKDISGTGMDTNIIGRMRIAGEPEPDRPAIASIIADDLTEASHGNALGVGSADYITERLRGKIDFRVTYENVITSTFVLRGFMPIVARNPGEALAWALRTSGRRAQRDPIALRIRDTLHLSEVMVSGAAAALIAGRPGVRLSDSVYPLLDAEGELTPWPR